MGREIPALLGFCCLLAGALCSGDAQDLIPTRGLEGLTPPDRSALPTSVKGVTADMEEQTWTLSLSEDRRVTPGPVTHETEEATEPSVSAAAPFSDFVRSSSTSAVSTESMEEVISGSAETTTTLSQTFSEQDSTVRDMTSPSNAELTPITTMTANPTTQATDGHTAEATEIHTESPLVSSSEPPAEPPQSDTEQPSITTLTPERHSTWMAAITTNVFIRSTESPTSPTMQGTAPSQTTQFEVQEQPSVLDVGEKEKDLPTFYSRSNSNSLFVMIVSVFTVMVVMVVVVVGFHRYRQRNNRTEFRRLQDLPMDDMMEDTPLSLYSY